jgi:NADPH:quinone reductase-like Zn-dependent oxidoreductase
MHMLRVEYRERGPVPQDVLELVEFELPAPGPGEVLVKVLAATINPSDLLLITGKYGQLPPLPARCGNEGVGQVESLGAGACPLQVGQLVLLPVGCGSWASHLLLKADDLLVLPQADLLQLAMLAVNPVSAAVLLDQGPDLQPGDWLIQNAANSAIGACIIQLAKARGLNTINLVRRESAVAETRTAGAEHVLVEGEDLPGRVEAILAGAPLRFALDALAGAASERLANCLSDGGLVLNHGMTSGEHCQLSPRNLAFRHITLRGYWIGTWYAESSRETRQQLIGELAAAIVSGDLHMPVAATYPLQQVREAVAAAVAGARSGKILLLP